MELGRCVTTQKGVTRFPKGPCSREGKGRDILVFMMSDCDVESLFDGWRCMASRNHGRFWIDVFYEIPQLCFEYGTLVND